MTQQHCANSVWCYERCVMSIKSDYILLIHTVVNKQLKVDMCSKIKGLTKRVIKAYKDIK